MKKKILMIYPAFPATYWSLKHALSFVNKQASSIPLGLLTVAALLPENFDVKLIDMNVEKLNKNDIKKADMVFISAMIVQKISFEKVVTLCNQMKVPVVAGGPYPTTSFEKISGVNHFVLYEAEVTLPLFLEDYENKKPEHIYLNTEKPDITKTPPPRFDLIDFRNYQNIALQNSRGCPYNCEFCDIIELFGRIPRFKNIDQFLHEMDIVYKQGFRGSLFIVDDNFIGNKKKVKNLLRGIINWQRENNYPFSLFTEASIDMASDDELLQLMVEAAFDMVFVGIETPDKKSLKNCNKNQNLKVDLVKSIEKIQKFGIEVTGGFIVGFDEDSADIFDRQIEFIQKAGIPMAMVGILSALPHTQLHRRLEKEGRLKRDNEFSGNNTHNLQMSFRPIMPEKSIIQGYKKIISEIYDPKNYFNRCFTFLERLPVGKLKSQRSINFLYIRAFFHSFFKQVFSSYSLHYLRFLWRVILHRIRLFPLAIEHAIKGYHFFIITKEIIKADKISSQLEKGKRIIKDTFASIVVKGKTQEGEVIHDLKTLDQVQKKLVKKYNHLSRDMQQYLYKEYNEYISLFNKYVSKIKKLKINFRK